MTLPATMPPHPLDGLARTINHSHAYIKAYARTMLEQAKTAGEALLEAKERCPHGTFKSWVEANCSCSYRTARKYMQVAKMADLGHFEGGVDAFLDAHAAKHTQPGPEFPEFTKTDAEYAQKLHAMATRGGTENERAAAQSKLESFAKGFGKTAEEVVTAADTVNPAPDPQTPHERGLNALIEKLKTDLRNHTRLQLIEIIADLVCKLGDSK